MDATQARNDSRGPTTASATGRIPSTGVPDASGGSRRTAPTGVSVGFDGKTQAQETDGLTPRLLREGANSTTTFVPLAIDIDGTVTAVAVGDWMLQLMKLKDPEAAAGFEQNFVDFALKLDPEKNAQQISDPFQLFQLLQSKHELVFSWLEEVHEKGEVVVPAPVAEGGEGGEGEKGGEEDGTVRKSFSEVLKEVEEVFCLLMSMIVLRVKDVEKAGMAAGQLCEAFRVSTTSLPEFRLKLLMYLYNVFPATFPYRFPIFRGILQYAADANLFKRLLPYIAHVEDWMKDWSLDEENKRSIYMLLYQQLKKMGKTKEAYPFLKQHVTCYQGESEEVLHSQAAIDAAVDLAADSLRAPDVFYFDKLLALEAVQQLRDSPCHKGLYELLEMFLHAGPKELQRFYEANKALFEEHDLPYDALLLKIRLLSLASRCSGHSELTLRELGDAMGISDKGAVEEIVVQAIGQGLVDAKIDQISKTVQIRSAMHRVFGRTQWEQLLTRLSIWTDNVATLSSIKLPIDTARHR